MLINQAVARGVYLISPDITPSVFAGKVAIFGDSVSTYGGVVLTTGQNPGLDASYSLSQDFNIQSTIQKLFPLANVVNVSRGGMTTTEALTGNTTPGLTNPFGTSGTITQWITDNSPNKIVLRYGLADAVITSNSTTTLNNLQTIIDYAVARGIEVLLIGVNPAAPNGTSGNPEYYSSYYSNLQEANAVIINNGIISKATSQGLKYANPRVLTIPIKSMPDGIHPYRNFGGKITQEILRQLRSQSGITVSTNYSFSSPNINTSATEGATVTFTVNTTGVPNGTVLYWASSSDTGANTADITAPNPPLGTVTITNNTGTIVNVLANDSLNPETDESFYIDLYGSQSDRDSFINQLVYSNVVTISNYSPVLTYSIVPNVSYVEEGNAITFNITTGNVENGTTLYWINTGTANANDFIQNVNSNSLIINNNTGNILLTLKSDSISEGGETIIIELRTGSNTGPIVATSDGVVVGDLSGNPLEVEFMAVGGGGGGGSRTYVQGTWPTPSSPSYTHWGAVSGGGGGAGGFICGTNLCISTPIPIIIGSGGNGGCALRPTPGSASLVWASPGSESLINNKIIACGGGAGGAGNGGHHPLYTWYGANPCSIVPSNYYGDSYTMSSCASSCGRAGGSGGGAGNHHTLDFGSTIGWYYYLSPDMIGSTVPGVVIDAVAPTIQGNPGGGGAKQPRVTTPSGFGPTAPRFPVSPYPVRDYDLILAGGGGGGGGACCAGTPGCHKRGGAGGRGCEWPIGSGNWFAGGGGGGIQRQTPSIAVNQGPGGQGGGGAGSCGIPSLGAPCAVPYNAISGSTNTGGGGGGAGITINLQETACAYATRQKGGSGGSGVVIIRYPLPQRALGGDVISCSGGFVYHCFNSSGNFCPQFNYTATCMALDVLIVGGGGGGGGICCGGGGGAGSFICAPFTAQVSGTLYTVVVGGGGSGTPVTQPTNCGSSSSFVSNPVGICMLAKGGGFGGTRSPSLTPQNLPAGAGGSGGGAASLFTSGATCCVAGGLAGPGTLIGSPTAVEYVNPGGFSVVSGPTYLLTPPNNCTIVGSPSSPIRFNSCLDSAQGGGGGAGGAGCPGLTGTYVYSSYIVSGCGGAGRIWMDGNYYGGGGGAALCGCGGIGGGGAGAISNQPGEKFYGDSGGVNTGGGGGGNALFGAPGVSTTISCGGSGVVVVRYAGSTCRATGGVRCVIGGNTFHYFCSSGCFQIL